MRRLLAITRQTMKGAFRVKAFVTLLVFLLLIVIALPLTVKGDGTVRGHVQILLSYSLGICFALLCLASMWLACDSLCRDVDENHIHLIATKPIARWQIWLGKWLGIMTLNSMLLGLVGLTVYALLLWTSRPGQLTTLERNQLVNEVLVARTHAAPTFPDLSAEVETIYQERKKEGTLPPGDTAQEQREQLRHKLLTQRFTANQAHTIRWTFTNLKVDRKGDAPVYLRLKFFTSTTPPNETVHGLWRFGEPNTPNVHEEMVGFRPNSFHELSAPASVVTNDGKLTIEFTNVEPYATTVIFPLEDGAEVLYRVGTFGGNYLRSLLLLLLPLGLLTAIALFSGSFLTLPVALFVCMSYLYVVVLSAPLEGVLQQTQIVQTHSHGDESPQQTQRQQLADAVLRNIIRGGLYLTSSVRGDNPVNDLVVGRTVGWDRVGKAFVKVILIQGGLFGLLGVGLFTRRELAALQN